MSCAEGSRGEAADCSGETRLVAICVGRAADCQRRRLVAGPDGRVWCESSNQGGEGGSHVALGSMWVRNSYSEHVCECESALRMAQVRACGVVGGVSVTARSWCSVALACRCPWRRFNSNSNSNRYLPMYELELAHTRRAVSLSLSMCHGVGG
jgi:hypothetical protein